jgi:ATP/ADP translocase
MCSRNMKDKMLFSCYTSNFVIHFIYFCLIIFPGPDLILITFAKRLRHLHSRILTGFLWEQLLWVDAYQEVCA